jgi:hypothetical protein
MMKNEIKRIFIIQYVGYGDWLSISGMVRFLTTKYNHVYIIADGGNYDFIKQLYRDDSKIKVIYFNQANQIINFDDGENDILNLKTGDKQSLDPRENYYNLYRQIGPKLGFEQEEVDPDWFKLSGDPCKWKEGTEYILENNASGFYVSAGIPKEYRLDYFHYQRHTESEDRFFDNLNLPERYAVISEYGQNTLNRDHIKNKDIFVLNVNNIAQNYFDIIKVLEKAEEVHLLENSTSLLTYYLQYNKLMDDVEINFHAYGRREPARKCISKDDHNIFLDMVTFPKLKNWNFIYE